MISIIRAIEKDANLISIIGKTSFLEPHRASASAQIIEEYLNEKFDLDVITTELKDDTNIYNIIYYNNVPVGYSKIILNQEHPNIKDEMVTKLERLYLLKEYYQFGLGKALFNFNLNFSKQQKQTGMWLFVWTENQRAIDFYYKMGFKIIGHHNFNLSATHANPNHHMYLKY